MLDQAQCRLFGWAAESLDHRGVDRVEELRLPVPEPGIPHFNTKTSGIVDLRTRFAASAASRRFLEVPNCDFG
jgi:hypothetical protein